MSAFIATAVVLFIIATGWLAASGWETHQIVALCILVSFASIAGTLLIEMAALTIWRAGREEGREEAAMGKEG